MVTYRLLPDVVEGVGLGVDNLTLDLISPSTIVPQAASAAGHVNVLGHAVSLAIVESLNSSEELSILKEEISELHQQLSSVFWCLFPPWAIECFARRGNGEVDILLRSLLDGADDLFGGRVNDLKLLAVD